MENIEIYALGFLGQALFGSRLILQWWQSEKSGRVESPVIFWILSLFGSLIFLIYGLIREDAVIVLGQAISYYIYIRNLQLKNAWLQIPLSARGLFLILPVLSIGTFVYVNPHPSTSVSFQSILHPMMIVGMIGQLALNLRFVYQWYFSEKEHNSVLPFGFWVISTWASVLVIIYSCFHPIYDWDPVLLVSQSLGIIVYIRNMYLHKRSLKQSAHGVQ